MNVIYLFIYFYLFIYLFLCDLFNAPVSSSVYIQRPVVGDKEIINWKGCERKRSWPNLRYRLGISWRAEDTVMNLITNYRHLG
jgi:hypothetical protein